MAAIVPKSTFVALARSVPVIVTVRAAGRRPCRGTDARHRRRRHVAEIIGRRGGRRAARRNHRHVHRAAVPDGRALGRELGSRRVDRQAGCHRGRAEVDLPSAPVKFVPVIVTAVPPPKGPPAAGLTLVTVGRPQ